MLTIDGSYGEGGGQILRTSLALSVIFGQPVEIRNIRANRKKPGLAAQHLTAVRAAGAICEARISGDKLESTRLIFEPRARPIPGLYEFDVAQARQGGSAGAATLVVQTVLLPLAVAGAESRVTVKGGTHVPWSPSFHYLRDVYLYTLTRLGVQAGASLLAWGWYPAGGGEITVTISGQSSMLVGQKNKSAPVNPIFATDRGALKQVEGIAVASSLPAHIAQRMRNRAANLLKQAGLPAAIEPVRVRSASPGAGIFLTADYESIRAGFGALGRPGKPAEQVAEEAANDLLAFHRSQAAIDIHLADQLILPLALTGIPATLQVERVSRHTLTNIWVVEQFLGPLFQVDHQRGLIHHVPDSLQQ